MMPFSTRLGINPAFNLLTSVLDDMRKENKELHLMPYGKAVAEARAWYGITGRADIADVMSRMVVNDTLNAQPKERPNVVVILMESMSASLMQTSDSSSVSRRPSTLCTAHHWLSQTSTVPAYTPTTA